MPNRAFVRKFFSATIILLFSTPVSAATDDQLNNQMQAEMDTFTSAWTKGDATDITSLNHPAYKFIVGGEYFYDQAHQTEFYNSALDISKDTNFSTRLLSATPLGDNYVLAIGEVMSASPHNEPTTAYISIVYAQTKGGWKIIFSHTSQSGGSNQP